jgi:hypothetical protein
MNERNQRMFQEYLVAAMTSGLKHSGATYHVPESLAIEYGRLCYNQAIKDLMEVCRSSNFGQTGLEICDAVQYLHIHQRSTP